MYHVKSPFTHIPTDNPIISTNPTVTNTANTKVINTVNCIVTPSSSFCDADVFTELCELKEIPSSVVKCL